MLAFVDFNNDGINDIIFGAEEPKIIYGYKNDLTRQVVSITDGMTRKTQFEYSPLNKVSTKATLAGDIYPLMTPMKVVTKLIEPTGVTGVNNDATITTYTYDKGKIHVTGKGFLGFETITAKNQKANISTITTNALDLNKYVIYKTTVETKTFNGSKNIAKQETEFLIRQMNNSNVNYMALLPKISKTKDYLLHDNNSTVTTTIYVNQNSGPFYGNPSTVTTNHSGIDSTKTTYTNYVAAGSWCESKPKNIETTRTQNGTAGSKTTIVYDGKGRIQSSETNDYQGSGGKPLTTIFTYDKFGNVLTTSASGIYNEAEQTHTRTGSFLYEPDKGRFLIQATDAAGLVTVYQHEPKFGNKTWEKDPLGNEVSYTYNKFGILTGIEAPLGNSSITRSWTASVTDTLTFVETVTTEGKPTLKTWYDMLGREVKSMTKLYNKDSYVTTKYNSDGTVEKTSLPYFTSENDWKSYTYDEYKRPKTVTALGLTTTVVPSSGSVATTYPDGNIETKTHNAAGQTELVSSKNGDVSYVYNAFGKPTTITAANIATIMQYDKYGNQTKLIDPDAGATEYHYNAFGELTYQKDANGNTFTLIYNNKGQLTNKTCNNTQFSTVYTYYTNGMLQKETLGNGAGKEYFYNDKGQLTKLTETIDGTTYNHQYTYDNRGNVLTYKYPSGYTITNEYDTHGYKTGVKEGNTYIWKLQEGTNYINEMGQITEYLLGSNNIKTKREYNSNFELTGINTKKSDNTTLFDYGYLFNHATGNLTSCTDNTRSLTETFGYDDTQTKHRLTSWKKNNALQGSTTYYPNGNIDTKSDAGTYVYLNNKPHAVDTIIDKVGNSIIHHSNQEITYNPFLKTATIDENGNYYTITYGTDGQRKKTVLNNTETRIYSGRYEKLTTSSGTKEYHYIPTPSGTIAVHIKTNGLGTTYFLLKDHLGSIMKIVTATGTIIEEHSYDAWGNHRDPVNWGITDFISILGIRGFTGHEMLPLFQLINMNGRMYDPVIGRMLAPDNILQNPFNAQNFNRYSYCLNNPLLYIDPTGEKLKWWQWALIGVGADMATGGAIASTASLTVGAIASTATITAGLVAETVTEIAIHATIVTSPPMLLPIQSTVASTDWIVGYFLGITGIDPYYMERAVTIDAGLFLSIHGWEDTQTLLGNTIAHFRNLIGQVDDVDIDNGRVLVNRDRQNKGQWGMTLGPYINSQNIKIGDDMYKHESGHTFQSKILGPLYVSKVAAPSGLSALYSYYITNDGAYHDKCWYEVWANILGGAPESDKYPRHYRYNFQKNWGNNFWYWPAMVLLPGFPH